MQVDIKTSNIKQLRNTFSNVARRLGADKPASRYQEATFDMQSDTNFHYRPIWDPQYDLYDTARTAIKMADWYSFKDPRQYYYGVYTMNRAKQQDAAEKQFEFAEKRGVFFNLSEKDKEHLIFAVLPLRHYEWGANMNNCFCTSFGYGAAITQATMYNTMDRLGLAQYVSRLGLLLDGNTGDSLEVGKQHWLHTPEWQELRRSMENLFVTKDWFEVFLAQNFVMDGLVYPMFYKHLETRLNPMAGQTFSMCTNFMQEWFAETQRWVDSTIKTAVDESPENKEILSRWFDIWMVETTRALQPLMTALFAEEAASIFMQIKEELLVRAKKIGLKTPGATA